MKHSCRHQTEAHYAQTSPGHRKAIDAFIAKKAEIDAMLGRISKLSEDQFMENSMSGQLLKLAHTKRKGLPRKASR
jgi:hypothetical protein